MRLLIEKAFRKLGFDNNEELFEQLCDSAMDGKEAVEKFTAMSRTRKRYSHIITDYCMPTMNGFDAAVNIRNYCEENDLDQPYIVVLTGHTEQNYIKKAF